MYLLEPNRSEERVEGAWASSAVESRKVTEWWPLLTIEIEVNGNSKSTNERGSFFGWFVGLVVPIQEVFVQPWLL